MAVINFRTFLSSLVMLSRMGLGLFCELGEDILNFGIVFCAVCFSKKVVFP